MQQAASGAPSARADGANHFLSEGEGPAVVLVHGVGLDHGMWVAQAAELAKRFQVIRYDLWGHGLSAPPPSPASLDDFVRQLVLLLDRLRQDKVALVGFSMGALIAQAFATAHPERLTRLVLCHAIFQRSPAERRAVAARVEQLAVGGPAATTEAALDRWFTPGFRDAQADQVEAIRRRLLTNDPHGYLTAYRIFATADAQAGRRLSRVTCPALVVTGADDPGSTPAMARALGDVLPNARVEILPGLRHMAIMEAPDRFNRILMGFLGPVGAETEKE